MNKFTKGPYRYQRHDRPISNTCYHEVFTDHNDVVDNLIAHASSEANAYLIAAAPDLYEVLAAFERVKDLWLPPDTIDQEHYGEAEALHKLRKDLLSALAKARGDL